MPNQGYQVDPVITVNDKGEEVISDLHVHTGHASDIDHNGRDVGWQNDWHMDSVGKYHHVFEGVTLESEEQERSNFNEDQYVAALYEMNPDLQDAVAWCTDNLPEDLLDVYNKKIDSDSLSDLNEAVNFILDQYRNRPDPQPQAEDDEMPDDPELENLSEEETEILNEAVDMLEQQEAQGSEYAEEWQGAADSALESGNETYATVAAATASFHSGEVTAEEAIDYCLNNCDLKELAQVYQYLMNQ